MPSHRAARLTTIGLAALGLAIALFYPTDEKRVRAAAAALLEAANGSPTELARALDTYASPNVRVDAPELPEPLVGRDAVVEAVGRARAFEPKLRFRVEGVEVSVEGERARLTADLLTALRPEVPELRRPRHTSALFERQDGEFRLISAEIGGEQRDQPEARP